MGTIVRRVITGSFSSVPWNTSSDRRYTSSAVDWSAAAPVAALDPLLLGGGGLKGGQVVGASEPRGGKVRERPISPSDLLATLYEAMSIPLDTHYEDASGRPVSIIGTGKPIRELL